MTSKFVNTKNLVERLVQSGTMGTVGDGESVWNVSVCCDNNKDWYVVASIHQAQGKKNRYFRVGRYDSEQIALEKGRSVNPEKLSKTKKVGTIDLYRNRTWRVRIKFVKENLHIGYFVKKKDAHQAMLRLMNDTNYLSSRCEDLNRKREINRLRLKRRKLNSGEDYNEKFATGKKRWTQDDVILLTKLRDQSTPWSNVARRLGRTIEACKSRIWRQSTEHLREGELDYEYTELKRPQPQRRARLHVKTEQSGRLARSKPTTHSPYLNLCIQTKPLVKIQPSLMPPRLPYKRRREDEDYIDVSPTENHTVYNNSRQTVRIPTMYNVPDRYPTSPRLDDDEEEDSRREPKWLSEVPEVKKEPKWSQMIGQDDPWGSECTFTNGFVDFLKDDNPSSPSDSIEPSKTSLFEIPSSSLNVEVKEEEKTLEQNHPWSVFFDANPYIPRFNPTIAASVNEKEEWWLTEK